MIKAVEIAKAGGSVRQGFNGTTANSIRVFDQNLEDGCAFAFDSAVPDVLETTIRNNTAYYCLVKLYKKNAQGKWELQHEQDNNGVDHVSYRRFFPGTMQRALATINVDANDTEKFLSSGPVVRAGGEAALELQKAKDVDEFISMAYAKCGGDNPTKVIVPVYNENKHVWVRNQNYPADPRATKHRQQYVCDFVYEEAV